MAYWFAAAAAVLVLELFAGTVYLMVVSAALFGAGLVQGLGGSISASVLTAAVLSAVGIWLANGWLRRRRAEAETAADDLDIGQTVQILRRLHGDMYEVAYRGTHWQAQAQNQAAAAEPQTAVIAGKNGNILLIYLH
ncbi:nodulation efficiency NfeD family protein [Neisseria chenwenguii]|uniref:Nodulation efficiency NfeD family protein n=1 Tax=Neisseria chenwenguii TaxID=1853278 RepID=A0A220S486_9NEIS|nr:NfeD family protein [Neisseria chenwenguii]ASK28153.1 nodulation efficiency NfeD family protein [Neisseria chenwenguii]